ncbi:hypothetical protein [Streptomyces sp. NPDC055607]
MNQDEDLAMALRRAVADLPVGPAPVDTVVRLGRRMRRRHRVTLSTALATAVLVPAFAVAALSLSRSGADAPAVSAASTTASAQVRAVGPGERIALGRTNTMRLTGRGMFLMTTKTSGATKEFFMNAAEVPSGKISASASGDISGTLYAGLYRSPDKAARVTVTIGGRTLDAQVVTLVGHPGWVAFYADDTRARDENTSAFTITVRAADGEVLASLTKPTGG